MSSAHRGASQPSKRRRRSSGAGGRRGSHSQPRLTPRSKSGCWTCRDRKVKCDEGRPSCANCVRLAKDCDYDSRFKWSDETEVLRTKSEVDSLGCPVWDDSAPRSILLAPPGQPLLAPFALLRSDDDRELKALYGRPGTFTVVATPSSFSSLPEYAHLRRHSDAGLASGHASNAEAGSAKSTAAAGSVRANSLQDPNTHFLEVLEPPITSVPGESVSGRRLSGIAATPPSNSQNHNASKPLLLDTNLPTFPPSALSAPPNLMRPGFAVEAKSQSTFSHPSLQQVPGYVAILGQPVYYQNSAVLPSTPAPLAQASSTPLPRSQTRLHDASLEIPHHYLGLTAPTLLGSAHTLKESPTDIGPSVWLSSTGSSDPSQATALLSPAETIAGGEMLMQYAHVIQPSGLEHALGTTHGTWQNQDFPQDHTVAISAGARPQIWQPIHSIPSSRTTNPSSVNQASSASSYMSNWNGQILPVSLGERRSGSMLEELVGMTHEADGQGEGEEDEEEEAEDEEHDDDDDNEGA